MTVLTVPKQRIDHAPETISYEEFLDLGEAYNFAEWVDGEVIQFMSVRFEHQSIVDFLLALMREYVQLFALGTVLTAPYQMRLISSGREPDVMFVANGTTNRITSRYLDGAADLAIEVVSPESVHCDRQQKFREYQEAGVREYWIIDPRDGELTADFYVLNDVGQYQKQGDERNERFYSAVIDGFWINPDWLWQADELSAIGCLMQMDGVFSTMQAQTERNKK